MSTEPHPDTTAGGRRRRSCCLGCLLLPILALVTAWWLLRPVPPPPPLTPQQAAEVERSILRTRQKLEDLAHKTERGEHQEFELEVTEAEMNQLLKTDNRARQAMQSHQIEDAWVKVEPGRMLTTVKRLTPAGSVTITAIGRAVISEQGELGAQVDSIQMGRIGIPLAKLKDRMQNALSRVNSRLLSAKVRLTSIVMESGKVVIRGRTENPNGLALP